MSELDGAKRAAVLLLQLGEEAATKVLATLNEAEASQIKAEMVAMVDVSVEQADQVLASWAQTGKKITKPPPGAPPTTNPPQPTPPPATKATPTPPSNPSSKSTQPNPPLKQPATPPKSPAAETTAAESTAVRGNAEKLPENAAQHPPITYSAPANAPAANLIPPKKPTENAPLAEPCPSVVDEDVFAHLKQYSAEALAQFLSPEQPQVIAVILGALQDPVHCAKVLEALPSTLRSEVYQRWNTLPATQSSWLQEVKDALKKEIAASQPINQSSPTSPLSTSNPAQPAFVFNDLMKINLPGLVYLLTKLHLPTLASAIQLAEPALLQRIWQNLPAQSTKVLQQMVDQLPAQSIAEIEQAQKNIASTAYTLLLRGEMTVLDRQSTPAC